MANKNKSKGKQNSGGEPKKSAAHIREEIEAADSGLNEEDRQYKNNIGPSGQGTHRGRETKNKQSKASGRPNVDSIGAP